MKEKSTALNDFFNGIKCSSSRWMLNRLNAGLYEGFICWIKKIWLAALLRRLNINWNKISSMGLRCSCLWLNVKPYDDHPWPVQRIWSLRSVDQVLTVLSPLVKTTKINRIKTWFVMQDHSYHCAKVICCQHDSMINHCEKYDLNFCSSDKTDRNLKSFRINENFNET